jgi:hypothetical protein
LENVGRKIKTGATPAFRFSWKAKILKLIWKINVWNPGFRKMRLQQQNKPGWAVKHFDLAAT